MHSFGFQYAFEKRIEADLRHFYAKCFDAATSVIKIMIETLAPTGFMLYSPDGELTITSRPVRTGVRHRLVLDRPLRLHVLRIGIPAQGQCRINHVCNVFPNVFSAPAPTARVLLASGGRRQGEDF